MDPNTLIKLERKFAPEIVKGRGVFSPLDRNPHAPWNLGGDKMADDRNGYARHYASLLKDAKPNIIVELGVFTGVSLAVWDALFPAALIIGLDLDFERFWEHNAQLVESGAFPDGLPELVRFDAYGPIDPLTEVLAGRTIDFFVDDGPHTEDAITRMIQLVGPLMSSDGIYVIEDYSGGQDLLRRYLPSAAVTGGGRWSAGKLSPPGGI